MANLRGLYDAAGRKVRPIEREAEWYAVFDGGNVRSARFLGLIGYRELAGDERWEYVWRGDVAPPPPTARIAVFGLRRDHGGYSIYWRLPHHARSRRATIDLAGGPEALPVHRYEEWTGRGRRERIVDSNMPRSAYRRR